VCDTVAAWQDTFLSAIGRRMVFAADEYYLMAERPFPPAHTYEGFPQHENGLGMARAFEAAFGGDERAALGVRPGFFAAVDGAPASGYRAPRAPGGVHGPAPRRHPRRHPDRGVRRPGARPPGRLPPAPRHPAGAGGQPFFGGNIGVSGLLTGTDLIEALRHQPEGHRYLLPDSCLSEGRFLDDLTVADLPTRRRGGPHRRAVPAPGPGDRGLPAPAPARSCRPRWPSEGCPSPWDRPR
jgi:hypothetical protein